MTVLLAALRNRDLRRVELAFLAFNGAEWAVWIAMLVYAYGRGGATTAGLVALAQLVPASLVAPVAARLGDRRPPARVLLAGYLAQALAMGATGALILGGANPLSAYAAAAVAASAVTVTRPAQAALMPALAWTPNELTAANVVSGWVESASVLAAPAATGLLLAVSSPGTVFVVMSGLALAAAVIVAPLDGPAGAGEVDAELRVPLSEALRAPTVRLLLGVLALEFVVVGALDVLYVVLAEAQLGHGGSWAGYLNAAFGAGGVAAVLITGVLVGRPRLAPALLASAAAWAVALGAIAVVPRVASVVLLLAAAGGARAVLDVAARTLLQRTAPAPLVARLFGVVEGVAMAALAAGSLLVPALVAIGGARTAAGGLGVVVAAAAVLAARGIVSIDGAANVPQVEIALLRSVAMLAPLDAPTVEALARSLTPVELPAGAVLMREGEPGDRFYVVAEGELDIHVDARHVNTVGRGDGVGEIALLRDVPRTATVTARGAVRLQALEREPFLRAVTGNDRSSAIAQDLVALRTGV